MKESIEFKVVVPNPWRWVGKLFILGCVVGCGIFFLRMRYPNENVDQMFVINGVLACLFTSFLIPVFMPCFVGKYPAWVVALFGRPFLDRLVSDCATLIGHNRAYKATYRNPGTWFQDQRVAWLIVVFGAMIAGVLFALT